MRYRFSNTLLSSSVFALVLGLGMQTYAATLSPGTTLLSDTPEFLDFQINLNQITAPFGTFPPGQLGGTPPPGPFVPLLLGQNWNIFGSRTALFKGSGLDILVEQATPGSTLAGPKATFISGTAMTSVFVSGTGQVSYLADSPAQTFNSVTCVPGSPNCVSYEYKALTPSTSCSKPSCNTFIDPIFELKGFFTPRQVPEGDTGIGALAALGLMLWLRSRHNPLKNAPKTLS
jgi:hypothetical protein